MAFSKFINDTFLPDQIPIEQVGCETLPKVIVANQQRMLEMLFTNAIEVEKEYTVVCFYASNNQERTIYAYMYLYDDKPEYVCFSASFVSMDGEFRKRFITYSQWETFYAYEDILERLEIKLNDMMKQTLEFKIFGKSAPGLEDYLTASRLGLQFFTTVWFVYMYVIRFNVQINHINRKSIRIIIQENDEDFYMEFTRSIPRNTLCNLYTQLTQFLYIVESYKDNYTNYTLGQKITPIKLLEYTEMGNINHGIWRELYCSILVGDLLINNICQGISTLCGFFFVEMDKDMFDNDIMVDLINKSEPYKEKIDKLLAANKNMSAFEILKKITDKPRELYESNILMSKYALVQIVQYVGRTWADMPNALVYGKHARGGNFFHDMRYFKRYTFDIFYNLLALNHLGIIQGDLHLNNCTINDSKKFYVNCEHTTAAYLIDDTLYTFPDVGLYGCVIDFSRAVLDPSHGEMDIAGMILSINFYMPDEASEVIPYIKQLYKKDPRDLFMWYSACDVMVFTTRLVLLLEQISAGKEQIAFTKKIAEYSKKCLMSIGRVKCKEWPIKKLIKDFYKDCVGLSSNQRITTYWSLNMRMKFSTKQYETLPLNLQEFVVISGKAEKRYVIISAEEVKRIYKKKLDARKKVFGGRRSLIVSSSNRSGTINSVAREGNGTDKNNNNVNDDSDDNSESDTDYDDEDAEDQSMNEISDENESDDEPSNKTGGNMQTTTCSIFNRVNSSDESSEDDNSNKSEYGSDD